LYAYRLNESAVILGTRDNETFNAPIGIKQVAQGKYRCLTVNVNETETIILTVKVKGMYISINPCINYFRGFFIFIIIFFFKHHLASQSDIQDFQQIFSQQ